MYSPEQTNVDPLAQCVPCLLCLNRRVLDREALLSSHDGTCIQRTWTRQVSRAHTCTKDRVVHLSKKTSCCAMAACQHSILEHANMNSSNLHKSVCRSMRGKEAVRPCHINTGNHDARTQEGDKHMNVHMRLCNVYSMMHLSGSAMATRAYSTYGHRISGRDNHASMYTKRQELCHKTFRTEECQCPSITTNYRCYEARSRQEHAYKCTLRIIQIASNRNKINRQHTS